MAGKTSITSIAEEKKQIVVRNVPVSTHNEIKAAAASCGMDIGPFLARMFAEWKKGKRKTA